MALVADKSLAVLIVDDDSRMCEVLSLLLEEEGFSVVGVAYGGAEAVTKASETKPDVVLMDIRMPGMDGFEAARRIKEINPETHIIAVTAVGGAENIVMCLKLAFSGYVTKPFDVKDLMAQIRKVGSRPASTSLVSEQLLDKLHQACISQEEQLRKQEREIRALQALTASVEMRETFVEDDTVLLLGALLHQLSNTIVPVREFVRLAKRSKNPQKYLEMIESGVNRANEILQRLRIPLILRQLQTTDLLDVINSAREQIPVPEDIRIEVDIPEEARMVKGNPQALLSVFVNLMLNAIQAMENGGTIVVKSQVVENEWIEIRTTDTGCGIPVETQSRLFEPFFTTKKDGQGLGLWLSKMLIKRLGGTLVLERSKPGEGSTFLIRLPLVAPSSENSEVIGGGNAG